MTVMPSKNKIKKTKYPYNLKITEMALKPKNWPKYPPKPFKMTKISLEPKSLSKYP